MQAAAELIEARPAGGARARRALARLAAGARRSVTAESAELSFAHGPGVHRQAPRRLRAADPARQADRRAAAAVADAVGGVARLAAAGRGSTSCSSSSLGTLLMRSAGCAINDYADRALRSARRAHAQPPARRRRDPAARGARRGRRARRRRVRPGAVPQPVRDRCSRSSALAIAALYPFTKRFFALPQAVPRHRVRLRHSRWPTRRSRSACRSSAGCCSPRTVLLVRLRHRVRDGRPRRRRAASASAPRR